MFKKLHTRYLCVLLLVLALCFVTFSSLFIFALNRTINGQMRSTLEHTNAYAGQIVEAIETSSYPDEYWFLYRQKLLQSVDVLTAYTNTDVTVCDTDGKIAFSTTKQLTGNIDLETLSEQKSKGGIMQSDFGGAFKEKQFVCIQPMEINGVSSYYAIATTSAGEYNQMLKGFTTSFWIIAVFVFSVSVVLFAFITSKQIQPIREMTKAAKKYAKGHFDIRIKDSRIEEIDELGHAFNNMADNLSRLEDMRNSFVQNVSHDLRTPMTTIAGFVDGILDGTIPQEEEKHYLELVSEETRRLSRLTSSLLDLSEIESGRNRQESDFDIAEIIRRILFSFEQKINEKKIQLDFDFDMDEIIVHADKDGIYRVVYNLVDNAIKYAFGEGQLKITTAVNQTHAIVTVYNTGMGIKDDDAPFVFDRFYKADKSRGRDKTSSGLGLYITKTIVEKNGGDIHVRSRYGQYCEFSFTTPLKVGG